MEVRLITKENRTDMKNKINIILAIIILILAAILVYMLIERNGNSSEPIDNTTPVETSIPEPTPEPTEAPHEHVYTETITTEATCTTDGLKTFTCECGDTYTEVIAMGHVFGEYIYNGDATYFEDGTKTAQCKKCEATDTRTAHDSKLEYTFTYIEKTMYAQQTVNVRNMPCTDGEKIGSLSANDEVWVVRQCNETGWYEINNTDISGYVSDSYLGTSKVNTSNSGGGGSSSSQSYTFVAPNGDILSASKPITWEDVAPSAYEYLYTNNTDVPIYINNDGHTHIKPGESIYDMEKIIRDNDAAAGDGGELIDNPNFVMGDGSGNYYDQYGNLVNP